MKIKIPLTEIFKRQTIRELSAYIKRAKQHKYAGIEAVEKREYYGLSSAQKRLYFLWQLDPRGTGYNMPLVLPLGKDIEKNKLEYALKKLVSKKMISAGLFHTKQMLGSSMRLPSVFTSPKTELLSLLTSMAIHLLPQLGSPLTNFSETIKWPLKTRSY